MEGEIETLHPLRWTLAVAIAMPSAAAIAFMVVKFAGGSGERCLRLLRYVLAAELLAFFVLCTIGYIYEHRAQAHDAKLYPPPGRLVDIGGYRLHLNCTGAGRSTIVLEYGLEGSIFDWHPSSLKSPALLACAPTIELVMGGAILVLGLAFRA